MTPTVPPQLADAAEFFGQAVDTVSNTFSQIGEQASYVFGEAYKIVSDITSVVAEQVSNAADAIGGTFNEVASFIGETTVNIAKYAADIFSTFVEWAQENPAYAAAGLVGVVATSFAVYYIIAAVREGINGGSV